VRKNLWLKVASVLLAVGMWMFVISRGQANMSVEVPVKFENLPQGLMITEASAREVRLEVRGHEKILSGVHTGDIKVTVDLTGVKEGVHKRAIEKHNVSLPSPLRVMAISPHSLVVNIEPVIEKRLRVRPVVTGSPWKGFAVQGVEVAPKEIKVVGTRAALRSLREVLTKPVDVSAASETVTEDVKIDLAGRNIRPAPESVRVKVLIREERK
jgi:YbbR domain-containing protein